MIQYLGRGCVEVRLVLEDGGEVNAKQEKINKFQIFAQLEKFSGVPPHMDLEPTK
jgi:hypothetical protein